MLDIIPLRPSPACLYAVRRPVEKVREKERQRVHKSFPRTLLVSAHLPTGRHNGASQPLTGPPENQEVHDAWVETPFRPKPRTAVYPHDQ